MERVLLGVWLLVHPVLLCLACGPQVELHTQRRGVIFSPSWPLNYPAAANCTWSIQGGPGEVITLSFRSFDLGDPGGCSGDLLQLLSPTWEEDLRLCGSVLPPPFTSTRGRMWLHFHSAANSSGQAQGFRLSYIRGRLGQSSCQPDEFLCGNGKCLPGSWRCNSMDECGDRSDEGGCSPPPTAAPPGPCPPRTLPCARAQSTLCLPPALRCDGTAHCPDGSDERGCPDTACGKRLQNFYGSFASPDFFRANRSAAGAELRCSWFLDTEDPKPIVLQLDLQLGPGDVLRVYDGLGQRAERLLQALSHHNNRRQTLLESSRGQMSLLYRAQLHSVGRGFNATYQVKGYCFPGQRPCGGGQGCYSESQRCDGFWNCRSGRDEEGCPACTRAGEYPCGLGGGGGCYTPAERCNNQKQCSDGADERNCYECQPGNFHCHSNLCILETWRCDGQQDCLDGSDEAQCPPAAVPRRVITAALIGSLVCCLLLVVTLSCAFRLHHLRGRGTRALERQMTHLEAEFVQREAPPSYGQLIAQGLIPPVEDFPVHNRTQTSVLQNLRSVMFRQSRRGSPHAVSSGGGLSFLWRRVFQPASPRAQTSLLDPPSGAMALSLRSYRTVEIQDQNQGQDLDQALTPGSAGGQTPSPDGSDSWNAAVSSPPGRVSRKPIMGLAVNLRRVALQRYSPLGPTSPASPEPGPAERQTTGEPETPI